LTATAAVNPAIVTASDPASKLMHAKYGYAALGGVMPSEATPSPALPFTLKAQPRLHPSKMFAPGQSYDPSVSLHALDALSAWSNAYQAKYRYKREIMTGMQDLNGYAEPAEGSRGLRQRQLSLRVMPSSTEVRQLADYQVRPPRLCIMTLLALVPQFISCPPLKRTWPFWRNLFLRLGACYPGGGFSVVSHGVIYGGMHLTSDVAASLARWLPLGLPHELEILFHDLSSSLGRPSCPCQTISM
jgi:hypothetical protein